MGDRFLKAAAKRLRRVIRESDTIARTGGDEFMILLHSIDQSEEAIRVAQRCIEDLKSPFHFDSQEFYLTLSIGISIYPHDSKDVESLLKNADIAMYRAKSQGKNTYQLFNAHMHEKALEFLLLENDLRRAVEKNEFALFYQPQVSLETGEIIGVEALIRWLRPKHGLVTPQDFIPIAEETGLIIAIGKWVLKTALFQIKSLKHETAKSIYVAVNLSAHQFSQSNLTSMIKGYLDEASLDADSLEIEITESTLMHKLDIASSTLKELKDLGLKLAVDDFGMGYSSLSYLKHFCVDTLKIDKSFISCIETSNNDRSITAAIIAMAHNLGLKTVAEGVEKREQLQILSSLKCDIIQGHLVSKPLDPSALRQFLMTYSPLLP